MEGGELVYTMGNTPNKEFAKAMQDRPQSVVY
jgi:putative alpha-1,2-mannosidase